MIDGLLNRREPNGRLPRGLLKQAAELTEVTDRTVQNWMRPRILQPRKSLQLTDDDIRMWVALGCKTEKLAEYLCQQHGRSINIRTVQRALRKVPAEIKRYALHGAYDQRYKSGVFVKVDAPEHHNDVWEIDHAYLPVWVWWAPGLLARTWITLTLDRMSRALPGYEISPAQEQTEEEAKLKKDAPDAQVVAMALCYSMAEHPYGLNPFQGAPINLACDNAFEFNSKQFLDSLIDFGITRKEMPPRRPNYRGKIERAIETFKGRLLPGLYGSTRNPTADDGSIVGYDSKNALLPEELYAAIETALDEYHNAPHSELGGKSPIQVWEEDCRVS